MLIFIELLLGGLLEVTLSSIRMVLIINEKKKTAGILAFTQVFVWYFIISTALSPQTTVYEISGYAIGYALGAIFGTLLAEKLIEGFLTVQIITDNFELKNILRKNNYGVTSINAEGKDGPKEILIVEINKKYYSELNKIIKNTKGNSFIVASQSKTRLNGFVK